MQQSKVIGERFRDLSDLTKQPPLREFEEIQIPVPWGHIAGKWYGPKDVKPVLAMHGWLDNAGSFDFLAALLPKNMAFLAIDWPGLGLSSPLPPGCFYHTIDNVITIRLIMDHFKWKKVALLGHSMSGVIAVLFAAIFPKLVEVVICLDNFKTVNYPASIRMGRMSKNMELFYREIQRSNTEPPHYDLKELIDKLHEGSYKSVSIERGAHLLARNIQESSQAAGRYKIVRDNRYKFYNDMVASEKLYIEMIKRVTAPVLYIIGTSSFLLKALKEDDNFEMFVKKENVTYLETEGTHHFHFNNPESIIEPVTKFLKTHAKESFQNNTNTNIVNSKL